MLTELSQEIDSFIEISKLQMPTLLKWVGILWLFNVLNWTLLKGWLNQFGIIPRRLRGLLGILFSPLLHGNFNHLLFNTVPLFFLGLFILSMGEQLFYFVTAFIWIVGGTALWIVGRRGNHIGASGLISGYFGYILANAYQQPTFTAIFCAAVAFYYFGGILLSLFPGKAEMSWEGHLIGFLSGILAMLMIQAITYWPYVI